MAHGYCVANALSGLAESAFSGFTPSVGAKSYINDGRMGRRMTSATVLLGGGPDRVVDIYVDLGSAQSIASVAVLNHDMCGLPDARVEVWGSSDGITYPRYGYCASLPSAQADRKDMVLPVDPAAGAKRYWLVRLLTTATTNISIGELFFSQTVTSLTRNGAYGSGEGAEIILASSQMQGGERRYAKFGGPLYERRYSFADWSVSELEQLRAMWTATNGPVTPLLWVDDVEATAGPATVSKMRCLYGHIQDARFDWVQDDFGVYQPPGLVLRSRAREMGS